VDERFESGIRTGKITGSNIRLILYKSSIVMFLE
jgi:hypothetical protein